MTIIVNLDIELFCGRFPQLKYLHQLETTRARASPILQQAKWIGEVGLTATGRRIAIKWAATAARLRVATGAGRLAGRSSLGQRVESVDAQSSYLAGDGHPLRCPVERPAWLSVRLGHFKGNRAHGRSVPAVLPARARWGPIRDN
jgi:hypothetical protein